ncbi:MAG TPA: peptidyl-prolyl cis-trans isomerase [Gammaproteobacteria bacterium]|nr:peptidyl-prolyl cis-trans isomerase [Gammaproteobacteria bacterium]
MKKPLVPALLLLPLLFIGQGLAAGRDDHPRVRMETSEGTIVLELDRARAPLTVENFLRYVRDGFYDGTLFHRVIRGFMIQGGGYTTDFRKKPTRPPVRNEADNGLRNLRGTIAMARTSDPHSATAQFFINVVDNGFLDFTARDARGWGYAVFGRVVKGMDVVDRIQQLPTGPGGPFTRDVPRRPVVIRRVTVIGEDGGA